MHLRDTLPCFRDRGERDLHHVASLPALPVDDRGERPESLHLLQHHADKLARKKTSVFTDGKHEMCIEDILSLTSLQLGFALTLTPATLCRLPRRVPDMHTVCYQAAQTIQVRPIQHGTVGQRRRKRPRFSA